MIIVAFAYFLPLIILLFIITGVVLNKQFAQDMSVHDAWDLLVLSFWSLIPVWNIVIAFWLIADYLKDKLRYTYLHK